MYNKTEFTFPSASGLCDIHAASYLPEGTPKAIFQISHGMAEHFERYEKFIEVLVDAGLAVYTNDHIGHGKSVASEDDKGYFGKQSWHNMIADCHTLYEKAHAAYPDLPYFFFGHSMGSFVAREYTREYGKDLAGAIYCGTGGGNPAVGMGIALSKMIAAFKGEKHRSKFINGMAFGAYNKKFAGRTEFDWLTKDTTVVDAYIADPDCGYLFTLNGYITLFDVLRTVSSPACYQEIPKELPILLVAGKMDPVGNYGKGVTEVHDKLIAAGHDKDKVSMRLYDDCRHEILNESEMFQEVCSDILSFVQANC
jgi:alpha-beta hydrolase superfamily lysophospholipase